MNNETDLDWLARNVHHWSHDHARTISYSTEFGAERYGDGLPYPKYTKEQWISRRAELQNKPSWDSAPINAEWRAQHSTGYWCWGRGTATQATNGIWYSSEFGTAQWTGCAGDVLGDWRDTIERRPDHTRSEMEVELVKAAFEPFTSIEDNQDLNMSKQQETQQNNGWFERGELPPVGVECEVRIGNDWRRTRVVAALDTDVGKLPIFTTPWCPQRYVDCGPEQFRPIRTDRDLAIDAMKECCPYPGIWQSTYREFAAALHDAGYRKESK